MKGMGNLMKQAQKLQCKMLKLQEELADKTVETTSGGGMVKVVANGRQQVIAIEIEKEVVDPCRVDHTARAWARFQDADAAASTLELEGGRQTADAGANEKNVRLRHGVAPRSACRRSTAPARPGRR